MERTIYDIQPVDSLPPTITISDHGPGSMPYNMIDVSLSASKCDFAQKKQKKRKPCKMEEYKLLKILGSGAFGTVF
jgi:hypothetical protein